MFDINDDKPAAELPEHLAKAHPAQSLIQRPGWICEHCRERNPVTSPFCLACEGE